MEAQAINRRLVFLNLDILHVEPLDLHQYILFPVNQEIKNHAKQLNSDLIAVLFLSFVLVITDNISVIHSQHFKQIFNNQEYTLVHYYDFFNYISIKKSDCDRILQAYNRKYRNTRN